MNYFICYKRLDAQSAKVNVELKSGFFICSFIQSTRESDFSDADFAEIEQTRS